MLPVRDDDFPLLLCYTFTKYAHIHNCQVLLSM